MSLSRGFCGPVHAPDWSIMRSELERELAKVRDYQNAQLAGSRVHIDITSVRALLDNPKISHSNMPPELRDNYHWLKSTYEAIRCFERVKEEGGSTCEKTLHSGGDPVKEGLSLLFKPCNFKGTVGIFSDLDDLAKLGATCKAANQAVSFLEDGSYFRKNLTNSNRNFPLRCRPDQVVGETTHPAAQGWLRAKFPFPFPENPFPPHEASTISCPILESRTRNDSDNALVLFRYLTKRLNFSIGDEDVHSYSSSFYPFINHCREFYYQLNSTRNVTRWLLDTKIARAKKFEDVTHLTFNNSFIDLSRTWDCEDWEQMGHRLKAQDLFPNVQHLAVYGSTTEDINQWTPRLSCLHTLSLGGWRQDSEGRQLILPPSVKELNLTGCAIHLNFPILSLSFEHLTSLDISNARITSPRHVVMCSDQMLNALLENSWKKGSAFKLSNLCIGPVCPQDIQDRDLFQLLAYSRALPMRYLPMLFPNITAPCLERFQAHFGRKLCFEIYLHSGNNVDRWKRIEEFYPEISLENSLSSSTSSSSCSSSSSPEVIPLDQD